jgi:hypothetical protein
MKDTEDLVCQNIKDMQQLGMLRRPVDENNITHRQRLQREYEQTLKLAVSQRRTLQLLDEKYSATLDDWK